jgi:Domain of unknown function (DUF4919)
VIKKISALLVLAALTAVASVAQQPIQEKQPQAPAASKPAYDALLERVKKSDATVDFKEFRLAYTETSKYSPYGGDKAKRRVMFEALDAKQYDKALVAANEILDSNYLDLMAHFGAFISNRELKNTDTATYHRFVFDGLMNSIRNSGDGKTQETAFVVISTDEEYVLFNFMGLRVQSQALVNDKGHSFDKMTALDPKTNETVVYYFNIDKPFNWLGKSLKN